MPTLPPLARDEERLDVWPCFTMLLWRIILETLNKPRGVFLVESNSLMLWSQHRRFSRLKLSEEDSDLFCNQNCLASTCLQENGWVVLPAARWHKDLSCFQSRSPEGSVFLSTWFPAFASGWVRKHPTRCFSRRASGSLWALGFLPHISKSEDLTNETLEPFSPWPLGRGHSFLLDGETLKSLNERTPKDIFIDWLWHQSSLRLDYHIIDLRCS